MIKVEKIMINDREFKRTYSDINYYIRKVGTDEIYSEAIDLSNSQFEYEETEEKIKEVEIEDQNGEEIIEDDIPLYNKETEYLKISYEMGFDGKIHKHYKIIPIEKIN